MLHSVIAGTSLTELATGWGSVKKKGPVSDRQEFRSRPRGHPPMGNPAVPPTQDLGWSAFAGGPDVETAVRTTGPLTAGRNPGDGTDPVCRTVVIRAPRRIRAVKYSATSTGAAGSQGTPTSSVLAKRAEPCSGPPVIRLENVRYYLLSDIFVGPIFAGFSPGFSALSLSHIKHDEPEHDIGHDADAGVGLAGVVAVLAGDRLG